VSVVLHLYGVVSSSADLRGLTGRDDVPVRLVADDELAVVVSEVEQDTRPGPADLIAHARVLEGLAETETVIPMQFGHLLWGEQEVRSQVLDPERDQLIYLYRCFDGLVQVSVQAFQDEAAALREVLRRDPSLVAARDELRGLPPALAQSGQVQLGQAVAGALEALQDEVREELLERLTPHARAVAELDAGGEYQVLNAALLVDRDQREQLDEAVTRLRSDAGSRLRIRYVGPQPPYAFLEAVREGELVWA
jgi:hypothetical protein